MIAMPDHAWDAVRGTLLQFRKHQGLGVARIGNGEIDTRILLQLNVVRRCAYIGQTDPSAALPSAIRRVVRKLSVTDRVVVDAELCLGLMRENHPPDVDVDQLYSATLAERRNALVRNWQILHQVLGAVDHPPALSARALRGGGHEMAAFAALATLLTTLSDPGDGEPDVVVVIGDAVIDHILEVDHFPTPGTVMWGTDSGTRPGGKGLNCAVALARLSLDTRMLAAIGDDDEGREVLDYLASERVDTSLIRVDPQAYTPITTVVSPADGDYSVIAIAQGRTRLTTADLEHAPIRHAISSAAAVVLTFEHSDRVIEEVLKSVGALKDSSSSAGSPWLIVIFSPSRPLTPAVMAHFSAIDYLVGTWHDLAKLHPELPAVDVPVQAVASRLLTEGVGTVCVIDRSQCIVHRRGPDAVEVDRFATSTPSIAGTASAFSAALTSRLVSNAHSADTADFVWATAAMATLIGRASGAGAVDHVGDAIPSAQSIDEPMRNAPGGASAMRMSDAAQDRSDAATRRRNPQ
ncbi:PfkB family carbohydrate kinase [Nocardia heshunensis]